MSEFKRERRYIIFKLTDCDAVGPKMRYQVQALSDTVAWFRERNGKQTLECVVVESDWPEYEPTWEAIKQRMAQIGGENE